MGPSVGEGADLVAHELQLVAEVHAHVLRAVEGQDDEPAHGRSLAHASRPPIRAQLRHLARSVGAPSAAGSTYREYGSPADQLSPRLASARGRRSTRTAG